MLDHDGGTARRALDAQEREVNFTPESTAHKLLDDIFPERFAPNARRGSGEANTGSDAPPESSRTRADNTGGDNSDRSAPRSGDRHSGDRTRPDATQTRQQAPRERLNEIMGELVVWPRLIQYPEQFADRIDQLRPLIREGAQLYPRVIEAADHDSRDARRELRRASEQETLAARQLDTSVDAFLDRMPAAQREALRRTIDDLTTSKAEDRRSDEGIRLIEDRLIGQVFRNHPEALPALRAMLHAQNNYASRHKEHEALQDRASSPVRTRLDFADYLSRFGDHLNGADALREQQLKDILRQNPDFLRNLDRQSTRHQQFVNEFMSHARSLVPNLSREFLRLYQEAGGDVNALVVSPEKGQRKEK